MATTGQFEVENPGGGGVNGGGGGGGVPKPFLIGGGLLGVGIAIAIGITFANSGPSTGASQGGGGGAAVTSTTTMPPTTTVAPTAPPGPTAPPTPPPTATPPAPLSSAPTVTPTAFPTMAPTVTPTTPKPTPGPGIPKGPETLVCPQRADGPPAAPATPKEVIMSISYGPAPLKTGQGASSLPHDDFWEDEAKPMWGDRGDLAIIKSMGANAVRLYGNHGEKDHTMFLDKASELGLSVIPGMSDYPYTQAPDNCGYTTDLDCYEIVKLTYGMNLDRGGFLTADKNYHSALTHFIIFNEPDIKIGGGDPNRYMKGLVSAFDGVLEAEKERGVTDERLKFTFTFGFGLCGRCQCYDYQGGLGNMYEFRHAVQYPEQYGYTAKNDLWTAYQRRFFNSANAFSPSDHLISLIFNQYEVAFADTGTEFVFGEYHNVNRGYKQAEDLVKTIEKAKNTYKLFKGFSFFEFSVRYDKGGSELEFGMFGLGSQGTDFNFNGSTMKAWCLTAAKDWNSHEVVHEAVTKAMGGPGIASSGFDLCGDCTDCGGHHMIMG